MPTKTASKINHDARRWAVVGRGVKFDVWWMSTGFTSDEESCGLYTKSKAQSILEWLTSPEGITSRLESYVYEIRRVR
jgi:hypothetical protein